MELLDLLKQFGAVSPDAAGENFDLLRVLRRSERERIESQVSIREQGLLAILQNEAMARFNPEQLDRPGRILPDAVHAAAVQILAERAA